MIEVFRTISVIKYLTRLVNTRTGKVHRPLPVRWEFPSPGWVKINIDGATWRYSGRATCGGIFCGSMGNLLELSMRFLKFRMLWLLSFMRLYMLWRKLKRWDLLMSGWNVILFWFVFRLLLGLMFLWCFVIDGILVLITMGKSGLGLLIFFVKEMCVLISWLIYDLFIENLFIGIIGYHIGCSYNFF